MPACASTWAMPRAASTRTRITCGFCRRQKALVDVVLQSLRWWEDPTRGEHAFYPVINDAGKVGLIEVLEPDRSTVEHQERVVAHRARSEAARKREMEPIADFAAL